MVDQRLAATGGADAATAAGTPPAPAGNERLSEVDRHRVGLRRAMTRVEEASSAALLGRPDEWGSRLATAVDTLHESWVEHVRGTEGPGGLWEQIREDAPRLEGMLRRLRREHVQLADSIATLRRTLPEAGGDESRLGDLREGTTDLLARLVRHRQRGADLIYEAYQHDVGGAD